MKVAFLHLDECTHQPEFQRKLAQIMIASVRRAMPGAWILQMTDMRTPIFDGVDESRRLQPDSPHLMVYRLRHLARLNGDYMILDTDTVVLKDVSRVWGTPFDVALTHRDKRIVSTSHGFTENDPLMPYNTGVMFSRSQQFWKDALKVCDGLEDRHKQWFGDQVSIAAVVDSGRYDVAVLKCDKWNHTPANEHEPTEGRNILHFKGDKKKRWMLNFEEIAA